MILYTYLSYAMDMALLVFLATQLMRLQTRHTSTRVIFESITLTTACLYVLAVFLNAFILSAHVQINLMLFVFFEVLALVFSLTMTISEKNPISIGFELLCVGFILQYLMHFPSGYYAIILIFALSVKRIAHTASITTSSMKKL